MKKIISDVQSGQHVELDLATALEVICKTQSLGADWDAFLENASHAVLESEFYACISLAEVRDYVSRELEKPSDLPTTRRVTASFDSAAIYLQRYDIDVTGTKGRIFIYRTPTKINFDRARAVILFVLEFFKQQTKNGNAATVKPNFDVTMNIRGMEKFYDVQIGSGINDEAWVGFDFR
jgi:hypothetical protein